MWSASCANRSAASTASPAGPTAIPRTAGDASASAMRAMEDPMTRANCRLVSTSATPRSIIDRSVTSASTSSSVNMRSSGPASAKPSARQKRRVSSGSIPVIFDTSDCV